MANETPEFPFMVAADFAIARKDHLQAEETCRQAQARARETGGRLQKVSAQYRSAMDLFAAAMLAHCEKVDDQ